MPAKQTFRVLHCRSKVRSTSHLTSICVKK